MLFALLWRMGSARRERWVVGASPKQGFSLAFTPDGSTLVCGGSDGTVNFWQAKVDWWRPRQLLKSIAAHQKPVYRLSFSHDGHLLATVGGDEVKIWDARHGTLRRLFQVAKPKDRGISALTWFPDNRTLAISFPPQRQGAVDYGKTVAARGRLELWDTQTAMLKKTIINPLYGSIIASPDGKVCALENLKDRDFMNGELWSLPDGKLMHTVKELGNEWGRVNFLFSPDGKELAAIPDLELSKIFDVATGRLLHTFLAQSGHFGAAAFSVDSQWLSVGGDGGVFSGDTVVNLFLVKTISKQKIVSSSYSGNPVNNLAFSPDGNFLATSRVGIGVEMWKLR